MFTVFARRFLKGFLAGGIAQVVLIIGPGLSFHNLEEIRNIAATLVFAFIVGGLLGVEKMLQPTALPPIDSLPQ